MNTSQVESLKKLDPDGLDGSIQSLLLRPDIATIPFENALKFLVQALMNDKLTLQTEGRKMSSTLKENSLYHKILEN